MAIALVANTKITPGPNGGTTPSVDTTGASLLVVAIAYYVGGGSGSLSAPTDSKSNTWTGLTAYGIGELVVRMWYAKSPVVGTGHTFNLGSANTFCSGFAAAFSGVDTTAPFDAENGATSGSVSSLATGSVTPAANNGLVVAALCLRDAPGPYTINGSFAITDQSAYSSGANEGGALAYLVQTSAASANPTWSFGSSANNCAAAIATFKAAAVSPPAAVWGFDPVAPARTATPTVLLPTG